jgi:hypothetical protein
MLQCRPVNSSVRRLTSWLAVFAILLAALAPTVSRALAASGWDGWVEICSSAGPAFVKLPDAGKPAQKDGVASHLDNCPFCGNHAAAAGLPPSEVVLPSSAARDVLPELFYRAPSPLFAWASSQPRAPPARG